MADERSEKIEERVAWLEHHVTQQDKAMLELAERLDRLVRELVRLRQRVDEGGGHEGRASLGDGEDERPPHY
jgi:SlyX protein